MNRFKNRRMLTRRSRRQQAHGTGDTRAFVGQDVTESILRHHHIKETRVLNHTHGGIVHKHIIGLHFRILRSHLLGYLTPQPARCQHIGFVHHRQVLATAHRIFVSHAEDAFDFRTCISVRIVCLVIILVLLSEIHTAGQFAYTNEVCTAH